MRKLRHRKPKALNLITFYSDGSLLLNMSAVPMTPRTSDPCPTTHGCPAFKGTKAIHSENALLRHTAMCWCSQHGSELFHCGH